MSEKIEPGTGATPLEASAKQGESPLSDVVDQAGKRAPKLQLM
jgi:hypothetical protein